MAPRPLKVAHSIKGIDLKTGNYPPALEIVSPYERLGIRRYYGPRLTVPRKAGCKPRLSDQKMGFDQFYGCLFSARLACSIGESDSAANLKVSSPSEYHALAS